MKKASAMIFVILVLLITSPAANAAVFYVRANGSDSNPGTSWALAKRTIQAGADAAYANGGGEIWVAAGTYAEHVYLRGSCQLYGGFASTESQRSERNFSVNKSIIDGSGNGYVIGARFPNNICIDGFTIRNSGSSSKGILCDSAGLIVTNNVITGNGQGIYCYSPNVKIISNIISGNSCGVYCDSLNTTIANNIISDNEDGIYCSPYSNPAVTNNTIIANTKHGISCSSSPAIANNIIVFNMTGVFKNSGSPTLQNNCVYGNNDNYSGLTAGSTDISQDPLLENWRYGKFHIQPSSPCVDAGDSAEVDSAWTDMDGQTRVQGASVDIGADESDGTQWYINPPIVVRVAPNGNDSKDGSSWTLAKKTIQAGIDAVFANQSGEVWVAAGIYREHITLKADIGVYGGFAEIESERSKRDFNVNKSILDGFYGNVVSASGFSTIACIDGFTIRNSGSSYYGIYCKLFSSPTLVNNIISGNGYGIQCNSSNPTIANNIISGNTYGIGCSSSDPIITNNTIIGNSNYGISCSSLSHAIANNIVAFNNIGIYKYGVDTSPTLKNNCVYGNITNYSGVTAGDTDISVDPMIENWKYNKFHIQSGSPCIDAGDSSLVDSGWVDMNGQPRIQGNAVDIGADESDGTEWPVNPSIVVRVSPNGNDSNNGSSWALAKKTIHAGIDAVFANEGGGEVWVAAGVYKEYITLQTDIGVYGGFAGTENERFERDFNTNESILDGSGKGGSVEASGFITTACIDGFVIRNSGNNYNGIDCYSLSSPEIRNNVIINNGHGIDCSSASPKIINNTISVNSSSGIDCSSSNLTAINNTISGNSGDGIYCRTSNLTATNNIIAFNNTGVCKYTENGSGGESITLKNNCVYGNTTDYSGITAGATDISQDPLLENWRYGKCHIQPGSPCIDTGDSSAVDLGCVDIDGQSRIQGNAVDIGADESDGTQRPVNPPIVVRVSPSGNDSNDGSSWALAKKTIQASIDVVYDNGGGEVWVAAGVYSEHIAVKASIGVYGGFAGTESQRGERNFSANKSIIDGSGNGSVVCASGLPTIAHIDGFTIRNSGKNYYGIYCTLLSSSTIANNAMIGNDYGIYCESSSNPTIVNNAISRNSYCGIYCSSNPTIINNTVCGNNSYGIYCITNSSPIVANNIVSFNNVGIYKYSTSGSPILKNNCIYGNAIDYLGITAGSTDISKDPLLENWRCDKFHIQPASPCKDTGDSSVVDSGWVDMDGQARIQGNTVDIGADESDGTQWKINPVVIRVSPTGNDSNSGLGWALAKKTIQASIDAVYDNGGGEVWVAAGVYKEHINLKADIGVYGGFAGTENERQERNFGENKSTIDGSGNGNVVNADGISTTACIDGFSINYGGNGYYGIYCTAYSNPKITNNNITWNGVGIYCQSNACIKNNTLYKNSSNGIYCCNASNPTIDNNVISGSNFGIYYDLANPTISNNTISENNNGIYGDSTLRILIINNKINSNGYGINCANSTIANNIISGNKCGVICGNSTIANNTIIRNNVYGISCAYSCIATNNIVAFNVTGITSSESPTLKNNCVYDNTTNYSGVIAGATDISKDPLFENWPYGKLHIQPGSPCIDAGDSSLVDTSWVDMDGQARIQGNAVDIGADESDGTQWPVNPPLVAHVSPNGDDSNNGSSWELAKKTVQAGIDAVFANEGGEVWVAAGNYYEHITLKADCNIYGGFASTESQRGERDFGANKSIIDGSGKGTVVSASGFSTIACIDGFIVRNSGNGYYGICCASYSSPLIINNIISGNGRGIYSVADGVSMAIPTIINNIIRGNTQGVSCMPNCVIANNTISENIYGICCANSTISNNIVVFNTTGIYKSYGNPTLKSNCIYGNTTNYSGLTAGTTDISVDPLFRDKDNADYHLTSTSPCVNAGDDTAVQTGWVDMDGEARIAGSHVDIGADEYSVFDVTGTNAKNTKDTVYVLAANMVASSVYSGFYYVQDINRTYGIRVNQLKGTLPQVNQIISVNGVLGTTTDGERCLSSYETPSVTGQETAKPLMITCKYIGGGDYSYDPAAKTGQKGVKGSFGLNNIGLLVTVCGTVADIDTTNKKLYINDGSATIDVYYGSITLPSDVVKGALVKATGACSCYRLDNNNLSPLILLKDGDSIAALSNP